MVFGFFHNDKKPGIRDWDVPDRNPSSMVTFIHKYLIGCVERVRDAVVCCGLIVYSIVITKFATCIKDIFFLKKLFVLVINLCCLRHSTYSTVPIPDAKQ